MSNKDILASKDEKGGLVIPPQSQKANLHIIPWPICFAPLNLIKIVQRHMEALNNLQVCCSDMSLKY